MDDATKQEFKDYIFQAIQAGKKETSDLAEDILKKQDGYIHSAIEKYVNGHLREIKTHLLKQDESIVNQNYALEKIQEEQIRVREKLELVQSKTQPLVDSRSTLLNVGRFIIWIGAISGASAAIIWLIDRFSNQ